MPLIPVSKLALCYSNVLNSAFTIEARVGALENAVTQLQQQLTTLQKLVNTMQASQNHGYTGTGLADPQILMTLTDVVVPFFDAG